MDTSRFLPCTSDIEHPFDPSSLGIALPLPVRDFTLQRLALWNAPVQTLFVQHSDFDLYHIPPL